MSMSGGIVQEAVFFAASFVTGAALLESYRLILLLRDRILHFKWATGIGDFLYWCAAALVIFGMIFRENEGTIRWYVFIGLVSGAWSAQKILSILGKILRKRLKKRKKKGKIDK